MEPTVQNIAFFVLLVFTWLGIGFWNYTKRLKIIKQYKKLIDELTVDEKRKEDMYISAKAFNYRENLKNKYEPLEEIRLQYIENEKKTKAQLLGSFLLLGPLYNIR